MNIELVTEINKLVSFIAKLVKDTESTTKVEDLTLYLAENITKIPVDQANETKPSLT